VNHYLPVILLAPSCPREGQSPGWFCLIFFRIRIRLIRRAMQYYYYPCFLSPCWIVRRLSYVFVFAFVSMIYRAQRSCISLVFFIPSYLPSLVYYTQTHSAMRSCSLSLSISVALSVALIGCYQKIVFFLSMSHISSFLLHMLSFAPSISLSGPFITIVITS